MAGYAALTAKVAVELAMAARLTMASKNLGRNRATTGMSACQLPPEELQNFTFEGG